MNQLLGISVTLQTILTLLLRRQQHLTCTVSSLVSKVFELFLMDVVRNTQSSTLCVDSCHWQCHLLCRLKSVCSSLAPVPADT